MSTTIDQRVVEMRFDNSHFEQNVSTTMSTLDKLKQKLHLDGATKGLEDVNNAAKGVKMNGLGAAVESVSAKFSALQVMGVTALANITNSAVNAGKRIVHALTIAPVKDGFSEYEMVLNAVQTTMAGTGKTAKEVEAELKKLDEYADKTVYSTSDMLNNLPKFTNAGVELEKATKAMIGIANATALAGGDAGKASIAFYNLGQAIGTGYLTRMDYNSINNAGIATMEWKNQMVEAALAQDTLTKVGEDSYKAGKKTFTLQQLFIDGLQEQWATTDVMMKVFGDYGTETTEIGKKSYAAAQDIKTFSMMMDSLKATAGTGWKDTWQIVFGGLDEAKKFWTSLSNFISGIITSLDKVRNGILSSALGRDFMSIAEKLTGAFKPATDAIDKVKKSVEEVDKVVEEVINGKWGRGQTRFDALAKAGYNYCEVQNKVNEELNNSFRYTKEQIEAQDKLLGVTKKQTGATTELTDERKKQLKNLMKLGDAQLAAKGYTDEEIDALKQLRKEAKKLGMPVDDFIDKLDEINGRWLLINSFKNIGQQLVGVFKALGAAWKEVFPNATVENAADGLYNLITAFHRLTSGIDIVDDKTGELTKTGDKIRRTFKGVLAAVDIVATVLSGPLRLGFEIVSAVFKRLGIGILDITARIGDGISKFREKMDQILGPLRKLIVDNVSEWIAKLKETEFFKDVGEWFETASEKISAAVDNISKKMSNFKSTNFMKGLTAVKTFLLDLSKSIINSKFVTGIVDGVVWAFEKLKAFFSKFKLPEFNIDNLKKFTTNLSNLGDKIRGTEKTGFFGGISGFGQHLKDNVLGFKWTTFKDNALKKFTEFYISFGDDVKAAFEAIKGVFQAIKTFIFGTEDVTLPDILELAKKFLALIVLIKTLNLLNNLAEPFDNITDALNNFAASLKWKAISGAFKSLALVLAALTICIVVLTQLPDMNKAWQAAGMLAGLIVIMGAAVTAMGIIASKTGNGLDTVGVTLSLLALMGSIALLIYAVKEIDELNLKDPRKTFTILAGVLLAMTLGIRAMSKAAGSSFKSVAAILTMMTALKMLLDIIDAYEEYDWSGKRTAIKRVMEMLLGLSLALRIASSGTKAGASSAGLAWTLLAMVVSLKILLGVIKEFATLTNEEFLRGGAAVIVLLGVLTGMAIALGKANKGSVLEKGQKTSNNFVGMAIALLAVVGAIWLLGKMASTDLRATLMGLGGVIAVLLLFTLMFSVIGKSANGNQKSVNHLAGLAMALLAVVGAIWLLGKMATDDLEGTIKGLIGVIAILLTLTLMLSAIGKSTSGIKMGPVIVMMLGVGVLIAELAYIINKLKDVPLDRSLGIAGALVALMFAMAGFLVIVSKIKVNPHMIGSMVAFGAVLASLFLVVEVLKKMSGVENAIGNATALGILAGVLALCLLPISLAGKMATGGMIVGVGALILLALALRLLVAPLAEMEGLTNARENAITLGILAAALALAMVPMAIAGSMIYGALVGTVAMVALMLALRLVVDALASMDDLKNARQNAITLGILAIALSLAMIPMALAGSLVYGALAGAVALTLLMYSLRFAVEALAGMEGLENARQNAITLGILAIALSLAMIPMALAGSLVYGALAGAVAMAGLMFALRLAVVPLANMEGLENARRNAVTLGILAIALSLAMIPMALAGSLVHGALVGVVAMAGLMASLYIVVGVLSAMDGLANAQASANILIQIMTVLGTLLLTVSLLAPLAVIGVTALSALIIMIGVVGTLVVAIGLLMGEHASTIQSFVDNGIALFVRLAEGLGEMVSAFAVGLTSGLAEVGENLSKFAASALPFIALVRLVDEKVVDGAVNLAKAIGALILADFITKIAEAFGDFSLVTLAKDLTDFATNIGGFITAMKDVDPETAAGVEALCSAIATLTGTAFLDGLSDKILGGDALGPMGESIKSFATCIKDAATTLSGITDEDVENIKRSAAAGQALADLNAAIPRQGGFLQDLIGSKDLAAFGETIDAFADCIISYSKKITDEPLDVEAIKQSAEAGKALTDVANAVPRSGGVWQDFAGEQDLADFGAKLVKFGDAIVKYSELVTGETFDAEAIKSSAEAGKALTDVANAVPKADGIWQDIAGEQDIATFGNKLATFGRGLLTYSRLAMQIDDEKIAAITKSGTAFDEIKKVIDKVPESGGWGDKIFGSSDAGGFGEALIALADGVSSFCNVAAELNVDIDAATSAIKGVGTLIPEIEAALELIPKNKETKKADKLKEAVTSLSDVASSLNQLTVKQLEYDYSGIDVISAAIDNVASILNGLDAKALNESFTTLDFAVDKVKSVAKTLKGLNDFTYGGVSTLKAGLSVLSGIDVQGVVNAITAKDGDMASAMNSLTSAMVSGIKRGSERVNNAITVLVNSLLSIVGKKKGEFSTAGQDLAVKFVSGIKGYDKEVRAAGVSVASKAVTGAKSKATGKNSMESAGKDLGSGLVNGINAKQTAAYNAGYALGQKAVQGEKDGQQSKSPSKLTTLAGQWLGEGLVIGMGKMSRQVYNAGSNLGKTATGTISSAVSKVAQLVNTGIDSQPTIRPVLDLSDVRSGVNAIGSMFSGANSVGVQANVNTISSMMNGRSQNRANEDVVTAIDKLRKDLSNVGNTTYSIAGVTYDDGSNIAEAVRTITRAAIRERRV